MSKRSDDGDDDEARATMRAPHERAMRVKMISTTRPATAAHELDASEALLKRDGKDIHKRSAAKKARYAMVFPGQLSVSKEGRIGEMREMHTQAPVVYLDFEGGRIKMLGSIVRPKSTRYFTLNAKSKDRMNLEEWFESVIVFPSWYWIGTKEENPEEKPLALPAELGDLAGEAETDWDASVAAGSGKAATTTTTGATATALKASETVVGDDAKDAADGGRRPRRQAATVARKKMYADDSEAEEASDDDDDDGRVTSPIVVRGKVESFMPPPPPVTAPAPVRESIAAPARASVSAPSRRASVSAPKVAPAAKRQKKDIDAIVIESDSDYIENSDDDDDEMELDDDDDESESEDEDDDSDFE